MDYREIQRLARDPAGVRKIAKVLLTVPGLSDRQIDFLSDMAEIKGGITTRQGEFLVRHTRRHAGSRHLPRTSTSPG